MKQAALLGRFRPRYGASPLHLAAHLFAFAIAAFALDRIFSGGDVKELLLWYLGFVIAHDLIFLPSYCGLDRIARWTLSRFQARRRAVPGINHVRVPALISGLLLIIYAPLISGVARFDYAYLTGHQLGPFLRNWFLITAALFLGSGGIYALRIRLAQSRRRV